MERLIPQADFITPNMWELDYIKSRRASLPDRLITSVPDGDDIGAVWQSGTKAGTKSHTKSMGERWQVSHVKFDSVPHGGGDSLAALFLGRLLLEETHANALAKSVATVFELMRAADALDAGELPLVRMQAFINDAIALQLLP
jgi:pyridoxine kinase